MARQVLTITALLIITLCWAELAYRLHLYTVYGSRPYMNHVDDHYFTTMSLVAAECCVALTIAAVARNPRTSRTFVLQGIGTLVCVGYIASLWLMHQSAMLVTYGEWATRFGPWDG